MLGKMESDYAVVRRLFGCGVDHSILKERYDALDCDRRERLNRVGWRAWFTLVVRYYVLAYVPFASPDQEYYLSQQMVPSLEIYLLFTCIDTLAQRRHKKFPSWLGEQSAVIQWDLAAIKRLYGQYEREVGIGSSLRRVFFDLPDPVKRWLASNIEISRSDNAYPPASPPDQDTLVEGVWAYFYNIRRNRFTHAGIVLPTSCGG